MNSQIEELWEEAKIWINEWRLPQQGPLDMQAMADRLNVEIRFERLANRRSGRLFKSQARSFVVVLDSGTELFGSVNHHKLVFGHELGHIWLILRGVAGLTDKQVEAFCERFGCELAAPRVEILRAQEFKRFPDSKSFDPVELAMALEVDVETAFKQLAYYQLSPQLYRHYEEIYCADCVTGSWQLGILYEDRPCLRSHDLEATGAELSRFTQDSFLNLFYHPGGPNSLAVMEGRESV